MVKISRKYKNINPIPLDILRFRTETMPQIKGIGLTRKSIYFFFLVTFYGRKTAANVGKLL